MLSSVMHVMNFGILTAVTTINAGMLHSDLIKQRNIILITLLVGGKSGVSHAGKNKDLRHFRTKGRGV